MSVQLRLSGNPEEIEVMVEVLAVMFKLDGSGRFYTNHGDNGVRCYLTAHLHKNKFPRPDSSGPDQHQ